MGLNDLAYFWTALGTIKESCPALVPGGGGPLAQFSMSLASSAVKRFMRGEISSKSEAARGFSLFANNIFNSPGCRVDEFGYVTSCTTYEEHEATREAVMTSYDAASDMRALLKSGCSDTLRTYIRNLSHYAQYRHSLEPAPKVESIWDYLARQ